MTLVAIAARDPSLLDDELVEAPPVDVRVGLGAGRKRPPEKGFLDVPLRLVGGREQQEKRLSEQALREKSAHSRVTVGVKT